MLAGNGDASDRPEQGADLMRRPDPPHPPAWIAAAWIALFCAGCRGIPKHPMTVEQAQAKVDAAVPVGTSRDQVDAGSGRRGSSPTTTRP